nr:Unknown Function [uncultured bacterium]
MTNQPFPVSDHTSLIAPFWDDLNPDANAGDIYYATLGDAPNREFVVEWREVQHYNSFSGDITFQVVFFENSSDILFNYLDVDFQTDDLNGGASATIGIQTTADKYIQFSHDVANLQSNKSYRFTAASSSVVPQPEPLPEPPTESNPQP